MRTLQEIKKELTDEILVEYEGKLLPEEITEHSTIGIIIEIFAHRLYEEEKLIKALKANQNRDGCRYC